MHGYPSKWPRPADGRPYTLPDPENVSYGLEGVRFLVREDGLEFSTGPLKLADIWKPWGRTVCRGDLPEELQFSLSRGVVAIASLRDLELLVRNISMVAV